MAKIKATPLTVEVFEEKFMPQFERIMEGYRGELTEFKKETNSKLTNMEDEHEKYMDKTLALNSEVIGELAKLREEITVALHQYKRTNRRVDLVDKHLGINTSDLA